MRTILSIYFFLGFLNSIFAANIVIEVLASKDDNRYWETNNQMHLTLGHIKNVNEEKLLKALDFFNEQNASLLKKNISQGFIVEAFNRNGFEAGFHILEANPETTARFNEINTKLYYFLIDNHLGDLSDKTTPKFLNPKGYTPHIEFLEKNSDKIPKQGDIIHFSDWKLIGRVQR